MASFDLVNMVDSKRGIAFNSRRFLSFGPKSDFRYHGAMSRKPPPLNKLDLPACPELPAGSHSFAVDMVETTLQDAFRFMQQAIRDRVQPGCHGDIVVTIRLNDGCVTLVDHVVTGKTRYLWGSKHANSSN